MDSEVNIGFLLDTVGDKEGDYEATSHRNSKIENTQSPLKLSHFEELRKFRDSLLEKSSHLEKPHSNRTSFIKPATQIFRDDKNINKKKIQHPKKQLQRNKNDTDMVEKEQNISFSLDRDEDKVDDESSQNLNENVFSDPSPFQKLRKITDTAIEDISLEKSAQKSLKKSVQDLFTDSGSTKLIKSKVLNQQLKRKNVSGVAEETNFDFFLDTNEDIQVECETLKHMESLNIDVLCDSSSRVDQLKKQSKKSKNSVKPEKLLLKPEELRNGGNTKATIKQTKKQLQRKNISDMAEDTVESNKMTSEVQNALKKAIVTPDFEQLKIIPPYELSKKKLQQERKKEREKTKGKNWFGLPATEMTDEMKKDLEILQMRSVLDPKHFYKKNDLKVLPKYFQVGKVMDSPLDFYNNRITKKERKKTLVDELLADAEFQKYNKRKYKEIMEEKQKTHYKSWRKAKKLKKKKK